MGIFGRRRAAPEPATGTHRIRAAAAPSTSDSVATPEPPPAAASADPIPAGEAGRPAGIGPYDFLDVEDRLDDIAPQRLDLGSVILPLPAEVQLQVELAPDGSPQAVHLATDQGRVTVAAYAAPKSAGQWRSVVADLAEQLRSDDSQVSVEAGPWGRELVAITPQADIRFVGVDGYRWMVRMIAAGPRGAVADGTPLVTVARSILAGTVVRRDDEPRPVRTPLRVELPAEVAEQLASAHRGRAEPGEAPGTAPNPTAQAPAPAASDHPRRSAQGSAMQQLG
ncbi:DUF3710 domain-containing protein [Skermania piniformis]|uniref:DUF3710 domain-containing protein n=1 Tax=Skermania pinensis TaxID=39122 RepID=A0ABX8SBM9_9ACTN|nr:DUF3710 domain-containing protein [Skermania piniformis]QXQ15202.1 DUF3710 domain-containing protein [Skermania piniformis]